MQAKTLVVVLWTCFPAIGGACDHEVIQASKRQRDRRAGAQHGCVLFQVTAVSTTAKCGLHRLDLAHGKQVVLWEFPEVV